MTAVDPETLAPVPRGEVGIARIVDLANVDSAVAIQTADRVRVTADGVELLGRAPGAPPRGCSIADRRDAGPARERRRRGARACSAWWRSGGGVADLADPLGVEARAR